MIGGLLVAVCALSVLWVALYLVFDRDYEDGLLGRLGLVLLGIGAFVRLAKVVFAGFEAELTPVSMFIWPGLALFLGRHAWMFRRRRATGGTPGRPWCDGRRGPTTGKRA